MKQAQLKKLVRNLLLTVVSAIIDPQLTRKLSMVRQLLVKPRYFALCSRLLPVLTDVLGRTRFGGYERSQGHALGSISP